MISSVQFTSIQLQHWKFLCISTTGCIFTAILYTLFIYLNMLEAAKHAIKHTQAYTYSFIFIYQ